MRERFKSCPIRDLHHPPLSLLRFAVQSTGIILRVPRLASKVTRRLIVLVATSDTVGMTHTPHDEFTVLSRGPAPGAPWQVEACSFSIDDAMELAEFVKQAGRTASIAGPLRPCPRHPLCYRVRVGREVVHFGPGADI